MLALGADVALAQKKQAKKNPTPAAALAQQPAYVGDPKKAHNRIAMCEGCHGIPGYKTAYPQVYHVPMLGGQQAAYIAAALHAYKSGQHCDYLVKALSDYKTGKRANAIMKAFAAQLSEQDIEDLAAWFSSKQSTL